MTSTFVLWTFKGGGEGPDAEQKRRGTASGGGGRGGVQAHPRGVEHPGETAGEASRTGGGVGG